MDDLMKTLYFKQLQFFRMQRHDFLNHIQVIRGYLQLKMPKKALDYLDEVILTIGPQQEISRINQEMLQGILLHWYFGLLTRNVEADILTPPAFREAAFWERSWREGDETAFYAYVRGCLGSLPEPVFAEQNCFSVSIRMEAAVQGFTCSYTLFQDEEVYLQRDFSSSAMKEKR